ncbi:MAG: HAMP domain-containing protein [Lachnospiraceae bacterium]|nr:HAMP domain-containing protein [Lachnospiraceae bacterium]
MKNWSLYKKVGLGFFILDLLLVWTLYSGYATAEHMVGETDPVGYLKSYGYYTAILFIAFVAISATLSLTVLRTIRTSMKQLLDATAEIAAGNTDVKLEKRSNDEFGQLIDAYQVMVENMRNQEKVMEEAATGNMLVEITPRSNKDILNLSLKQMLAGNRQSITSIKEAAYQVMTSSAQVASASEALAQGSTEQASAIEEITASIDDIAEKTRTNATQANTAAELVGHAIEDVKEGNEQMHQMVAAMEDINKSSESISKIIKVIDDIAFQTNILALNAAVEAARAGDAGKGFAVVAEEVRNLAAKCSAAAGETAELIEDSIAKVAAGSKIADDTAKALAEITEAVQKSEVLINGIAESSNYQATAVAQVDQAIGQVSQVVQTNSATSEECAAASEELSNQAIHMRELLSAYQVGDSREMSMVAMTKSARKTYAGNDNERIISLGEGFGKY